MSDGATPVGDPRIPGVEELLRRNGIGFGGVSVEGHEQEIAAIIVDPDGLIRLAELAPEIKALGFRYVAVDLADGDQPPQAR